MSLRDEMYDLTLDHLPNKEKLSSFLILLEENAGKGLSDRVFCHVQDEYFDFVVEYQNYIVNELGFDAYYVTPNILVVSWSESQDEGDETIEA